MLKVSAITVGVGRLRMIAETFGDVRARARATRAWSVMRGYRSVATREGRTPGTDGREPHKEDREPGKPWFSRARVGRRMADQKDEPTKLLDRRVE